MTQAVTYQSCLADFHANPSVSADKRKDVKTPDGCGMTTTGLSAKLNQIGLLLKTVLASTLYQSGGGVESDLERADYEMGYFRIPASGVGAPHVRERAFVVANAKGKPGLQAGERIDTNGSERNARQDAVCCSQLVGRVLSPDTSVKRFSPSESDRGGLQQKKPRSACNSCHSVGELTDTACIERQQDKETIAERTPRRSTERSCSSVGDGRPCILPDWKTYPSEICRMDDGLPIRMDKPRLQALGNAIVPRVVFPIFDAIARIERGEIK